MPFNYVLTNLLVDVPEAVGAIFLDHEGEAIECVTRGADPYEMKVEGAYHSVFKRRLSEVMNALGAGPVHSFALAGDGLVALTEVLPDGYYVVLVLERRGCQARAQFRLREAARIIERELG